MVEIEDIREAKNLESWLEDQPREVPAWIASRAAARVLPDWWQAVLTEDWARKRDLTALPILRGLLMSTVAARRPSSQLIVAAERARDTSSDLHRQRNVSATTASRAALLATDVVVSASPRHAALAVATAAVRRDDSIWQTVRDDAASLRYGNLPDALLLWATGQNPLEKEWSEIKAQVKQGADTADWQFWIDWYDALLLGRTMLPDTARTWEMLEEIALIDAETWDAGPEVVNPVIREIWEGYKDGSSSAGHAADPEPVSENAKSAMKQRVAVNRDALVVASAGIIDQLGAYREQVRGMNHLEPDLRDEVLAFIDEFTGKLSALIQGLPASGTVNDAQAGRLVLWLREYRGLLNHKLAYYGSAENMAEATVPTGIILGATGIGAMLGMPVAGSVVGGLIVNQMKPGQAAKELTKPQDKDVDPQ